MSKVNNYQKGQALILIALGIVGLVGITALAIDGGNAFSERRRAQNAADTASLAAALEDTQDRKINEVGVVVNSPDLDGINWREKAVELITANMANISGVTYTYEIPTIPVFDPFNPNLEYKPYPGLDCNKEKGPYFEDSDYFQVLIHITVDTYFGKVLGFDNLQSCVEAVSYSEPPFVIPPYEGDTIVSLNPTDCYAVKYQGSVDSILIQGGIFVNSSCPDKAFVNSSNSASLVAPYITAVGGIDIGNLNVTGVTITEGATPYPFPPDFAIPQPEKDCGDLANPANQSVQDGMWLSPGNYTGNTFPPTGVSNLEPGLYCVYAPNGFVIRNSDTLTGEGVTIALMDGKIDWTGSALGGIHLSAPSRPNDCVSNDLREICNNKYNGLLLFIPEANTDQDVTWNGGGAWGLTGTILAPWADFKINGSEEGFSISVQIIANTITLLGDGQINISYDADDSWKGPYPAKIELSQ